MYTQLGNEASGMSVGSAVVVLFLSVWHLIHVSYVSSEFPPSYFLLWIRAVVAHLWQTNNETEEREEQRDFLFKLQAQND